MDAKAIQHAYKILGYRGRSVKELKDRLKRKGFSADCAKAVIEHLQGMGYLDDAAFAWSLRKNAEDVKLLGSFGARRYLRQMGISRDVADEALLGYDELAPAKKLLQRKLRSLKDCPVPLQRKRLLGYLSRRGYSAETIRKITNYAL
jgi:regulatory protein